jgi:hypothetical protein
MSFFVTYGLSDGAIHAISFCQDVSQVPVDATTGVIQGTGLEDPITQYVFGVVIAQRPACPVASSVSGRVITLTGLPLNSIGQISGDATLSVTNLDPSGTNILTFPSAGTYTIAVPCFPNLDYLETFVLS